MRPYLEQKDDLSGQRPQQIRMGTAKKAEKFPPEGKGDAIHRRSLAGGQGANEER